MIIVLVRNNLVKLSGVRTVFVYPQLAFNSYVVINCFPGFNVTVRTSGSQETALHRSVLCLSYSDRRHSIDKIKRLVHLLKDCLPLQDKSMQTPLHAASVKLITDTARNDYYSEFVMAMVAKAMEIPEKTSDILNAKDNQGNTALHYLAQNDKFGFVPLSSIINAGGDISILNKKKLRPLDLAINKGCTSIIKALNTHGKTSNASCDDNIVYSADSPPASPVNQSSENQQHDVLNSSEVESQADRTNFNNADTPSLEHNEDNSSTSASEDVSPGEPTCAVNEVSSAIAATDPDPSSTADDAAAPATYLNNDVPQTACPEVSCETHDDSPATLDALSVNTDEAGPSCEASGNNVEGECRCSAIGVQTPLLSRYSCIVHIKQEQLSPVSNNSHSSTCYSYAELQITVGRWTLSNYNIFGAMSNLILTVVGHDVMTKS